MSVLGLGGVDVVLWRRCFQGIAAWPVAKGRIPRKYLYGCKVTIIFSYIAYYAALFPALRLSCLPFGGEKQRCVKRRKTTRAACVNFSALVVRTVWADCFSFLRRQFPRSALVALRRFCAVYLPLCLAESFFLRKFAAQTFSIMKKFITLFALMLVCIGQAFAYDFKVDGICYNYIDGKSSGEVEVVHGSYFGSVTIPSSVTYNGTTYSVKSIGDDAFSGCSALTSVSIPESVTSIGDGAFWQCSALTSIIIPNSVTSIGSHAFWRCSALTSALIGDGVTGIVTRTFEFCTALTSLTIGSSVTGIGGYAFYGCTSLSSLTIPNSVTSIADYAFQNCTGLKSITIGSGVKNLGFSAFSGCSNVEELIYADGCTEVLQTGLRSITSVVMPNSVTRIEDKAFLYCSALTSVTIGGNVKSIGEFAFGGCSNVKELIYAEGCTEVLPTGLKSIRSVSLPNSVKSIGDDAFSGCNGLTSISLPESVKNIGKAAFQYCKSLTSVTIGSGVASIGTCAFNGCERIKEIYSLNPMPPTCASDFPECVYKAATLYVPDTNDALARYKADMIWQKFFAISEGIVAPTISTKPQRIYNLGGQRATGTEHGIYVQQQADGTAKKVMKP